ncbi:MAG: hypothetical protein M1835_005318 [Candelina submexicana]|nr:MAG: hypothetical protein M1835_005318 [Candelina submexicana]
MDKEHRVGYRRTNSTSGREGQARFPHEFRYTTVRAVTPDSGPEKKSSAELSLRDKRQLSSPPTSPQSFGAGSPRDRLRESASRGSRNNTTLHKESIDYPMRPRTRTLDENTHDRSPTALKSRHRHGVGSIHSTSSVSHDADGEAIYSVGFPSIIPLAAPPPAKPRAPARQRPFKISPRTASPQTQTDPYGNALPSPIATANANRILNLMKSTCGETSGKLSFRMGESGSWYTGHCYVNVESGSLMYDPNPEGLAHKTLVPDLRGCQIRTLVDTESQITHIEMLTHSSGLELHLRPNTLEALDVWLAALLCWQPIRPKGAQNKMTKPQNPVIAERRLGDRRKTAKTADTATQKKSAVIKVGKMQLWNRELLSQTSTTPTARRHLTPKDRQSLHKVWRKVSCILQENGEFKLYIESDVTLVSFIQLSQLSRCAIQQLDPSVLEEEFCIAIYPQYASNSTALSLISPVYLSLESRVLFEVWFVLLRAFTIPELYGPEPKSSNGHASTSQNPQGVPLSSTSDLFRMERSLSLRVIEAKLHDPEDLYARHKPLADGNQSIGEYYAEVWLDGEVRARTTAKASIDNPFWREEYEFSHMPAVLSSASVLIKRLSKDQKHCNIKVHEPNSGSPDNAHWPTAAEAKGTSTELIAGRLDLDLDDIEEGRDLEKWWPMLNANDEAVGEILMKVRMDELVVLMCKDYQPLSELLHKFSSGLTGQIAHMASSELRRLSEILLNIFQVSGQASEWLMALIEDEIDGVTRETTVNRLRFSRRHGSNDSYDSAGERELFLRDLGKSATVEANLLFRGNSLLTKSLDFHMKRLGKEYLEETLCEQLREIEESDVDCEVDPNRVKNSDDLEKNWRNLLALTKGIWDAIVNSAARCPPELRMIFRHIRACAEDRYGDFLRTVAYSSVSGFLFLRFFCPAVLNPKLFGLLKDHPHPKAQRTLTLIAKSLQGLANLTSFGVKEAWMEPMNQFLVAHRQQFKDFIDTICSISPDRASTAIPPSYATPITILARLPPTSREGFPSLPYLIDHARNFAALVELWLKASNTARRSQPMEGDLLKFHRLCVDLQQHTEDCLSRAEQAERPTSRLSVKWEELVENLEASAVFDPMSETRHSPHLLPRAASNGTDTPPGSAGWDGGTPSKLSVENEGSFSKNSSQYSLDMEIPVAHRSASRDGSKHKFSDFVGGFRRKAKEKGDTF